MGSMNIEVSTYYELFHLLQTQPMFNFLKNLQQVIVIGLITAN